jgi:hypothetical protein
MNKILIESVYWTAFVCYVIPFLVYIYKIHYYIVNNDLFQLFNYSILACAFLALSVHTFIIALDAKNERDTVESLYYSPARLGYGLIVLHFIITFAFAYFHNEAIYFRSIIAIIGYLCLTLKINYGIFLLILYYIISLFVVHRFTPIELIYGISKAGLIFYFSIYAYKYITA